MLRLIGVRRHSARMQANYKNYKRTKAEKRTMKVVRLWQRCKITKRYSCQYKWWTSSMACSKRANPSFQKCYSTTYSTTYEGVFGQNKQIEDCLHQVDQQGQTGILGLGVQSFTNTKLLFEGRHQQHDRWNHQPDILRNPDQFSGDCHL